MISRLSPLLALLVLVVTDALVLGAMQLIYARE